MRQGLMPTKTELELKISSLIDISIDTSKTDSERADAVIILGKLIISRDIAIAALNQLKLKLGKIHKENFYDSQEIVHMCNPANFSIPVTDLAYDRIWSDIKRSIELAKNKEAPKVTKTKVAPITSANSSLTVVKKTITPIPSTMETPAFRPNTRAMGVKSKKSKWPHKGILQTQSSRGNREIYIPPTHLPESLLPIVKSTSSLTELFALKKKLEDHFNKAILRTPPKQKDKIRTLHKNAEILDTEIRKKAFSLSSPAQQEIISTVEAKRKISVKIEALKRALKTISEDVNTGPILKLGQLETAISNFEENIEEQLKLLESEDKTYKLTLSNGKTYFVSQEIRDVYSKIKQETLAIFRKANTYHNKSVCESTRAYQILNMHMDTGIKGQIASVFGTYTKSMRQAIKENLVSQPTSAPAA